MSKRVEEKREADGKQDENKEREARSKEGESVGHKEKGVAKRKSAKKRSPEFVTDFENRVNEVKRISLLFISELETISNVLRARQKYVLRKRPHNDRRNTEIGLTTDGDTKIGLIDSSSLRLVVVVVLVNCRGPFQKADLNRREILSGLCVKSVEEMGPVLSRWKQSYLWELHTFGVIDGIHEITANWKPEDGIIFAAKGKLTSRFKHSPSIYRPFAKLIPMPFPKRGDLTLPEFVVNSTPFVIGRDKYQSNAVWKKTGKLGISRRHCTLQHDYGTNQLWLTRDSKTNDMLVGRKVLAVGRKLPLSDGCQIAFNADVRFRVHLLQKQPWREGMPQWLLSVLQFDRHRARGSQRRAATPPPSVGRSARKKRRAVHLLDDSRPLAEQTTVLFGSNLMEGGMHRAADSRLQGDGRQHVAGARDVRFRKRGSSPPPQTSAHVRKDRLRKHGIDRRMSALAIGLTQDKEDNGDDNMGGFQSLSPMSFLKEGKRAPLRRRFGEVLETDVSRGVRDDGRVSKRRRKHLRSSFDLRQLSQWPWAQLKSLVFARYSLKPDAVFRSGLRLRRTELPPPGFLLLRSNACASRIVYPKHVGSVLTRHAYLQSILETLVILGGAKCTLNMDYVPLAASQPATAGLVLGSAALSAGMITNEMRVGNMGSGFPIAYLIVCDTADVSTALSALLVRLELLDIELFEDNCIELPFLFGIITDGCGQWQFVRRNNAQRHLAADVLNDALLAQSKHFDLHKEMCKLKSAAPHSEKFLEVCATLAHERYCVKKASAAESRRQLYTGCCEQFSRKVTNDLQSLCQLLFGILQQQCADFKAAFKAAVRRNGALDRMAVNPYHEMNAKQRQRLVREFSTLHNQLLAETEDFQDTGTQDAW